MYLIDSNIVIYSASSEYSQIRRYFYNGESFISVISQIEVLGYHKITEDQKKYFAELFSVIPILPLDPPVTEQAILLRQKFNMTLGDSIIAATAIEYKCSLLTRNVDDFSFLKNIDIINPID
jgi:toxin FitB